MTELQLTLAHFGIRDLPANESEPRLMFLARTMEHRRAPWVSLTHNQYEII